MANDYDAMTLMDTIFRHTTPVPKSMVERAVAKTSEDLDALQVESHSENIDISESKEFMRIWWQLAPDYRIEPGTELYTADISLSELSFEYDFIKGVDIYNVRGRKCRKEDTLNVTKWRDTIVELGDELTPDDIQKMCCAHDEQFLEFLKDIETRRQRDAVASAAVPMR